MKDSATTGQLGRKTERRSEKRIGHLSWPMAELRVPGSPTYQLKLKDASRSGAGIIVRPDSRLLAAISVGQEFSLRLLSSNRTQFIPGLFEAVVKHISELKEGPYTGHIVVGVALKEITS